MSYITPAQLAEEPGALELAQVASDAHGNVVQPELMEKTLRGEDRSGFEPQEVADADAALARILHVIGTTDADIDGYLRFRYPLPLAEVPGNLTERARAIVRWKLHKDRRTDAISDDYKAALKWLEGVRDGVISLGVSDPVVTATPMDARFNSDASAFGRDQLRAFR